MLVIRLKRIGKKNKPTYRVVVAEHSNAVNGPFVEDLGFYNPHTKVISLNKESITAWMDKGAKPSNRMARLLEKEKVKHKSIVVIKYKKAPKKKVEETKPAAPTAKPEEVEAPSNTEETPAEVTEEAKAEEETTPAKTTEEVASVEDTTSTENTEEVTKTSETPETPTS